MVNLGGVGASCIRSVDTDAIASPPSERPQHERRLRETRAGDARSAATMVAKPSRPNGLSSTVRSVSAGWDSRGPRARAADFSKWLLFQEGEGGRRGWRRSTLRPKDKRYNRTS